MFHKCDCVAALKNTKKQQGERNLLPSIAHERTRETKQEQPEGYKSGSINLQVIEDRRRLIHSLFQTTRDKNRDTLVVNHPLLTRLSES